MVSHLAVTGSSGLVGGALTTEWRALGRSLTRLVRRNPGAGEVLWDPARARIDVEALAGVDAVVHLAGENIAGQRWTAEFKRRVRDSRVQGTRALCEALAAMRRGPRTLVSASATGFYGCRGDETLDEDSPAGGGFLAETCQAWENATRPARDAGIRVVLLRFGMVLTPRGGALAKMLTPFRCGVGGRVGDGRQVWSWIALPDAVGAILHCLATEQLAGPVNAVSPGPVTNGEFTRILAGVLRRPAFFPAPAFAVRMVFGEMADALLLCSARVQPRRLVESGFAFRAPTLAAALQSLLAVDRRADA